MVDINYTNSREKCLIINFKANFPDIFHILILHCVKLDSRSTDIGDKLPITSKL